MSFYGWGSQGLRLIAIILALDSLASAAYYTASRAYVRDVLGGVEAYRYIVMLIAAETIPVVVVVALGILGVYGKRRVIATVSSLRAFFYPLITLVDPMLIVIPVFIGAVFVYMFFINALGALLESARGSARTYADVTLVFPIFWSIGPLIPGVLEPVGGYVMVFTVIGFLAGLSSILLALASKAEDEGVSEYPKIIASFKLLGSQLILALLVAGAGLNLFWNIMIIKLYEISGSLILFGLIGGTLTTLLSIAARRLAGMIADKIEPLKMLTIIYAIYAIYGLVMYMLEGLPFVILWLIPIYPFREISQTMTISRALPREAQTTAASIVTLTYNLPSITYPILYLIGIGIAEATAIYTIALVSSSVLIGKLAARAGKRPE
ncbi:MAG: hypothetical protein DJ555_07050 [Desulfurococcaceae archaeon]|nr:MAG: hypothetical protein DJ555_07050 [Desulfurococcaceae archaeon]